MVVYCYIDCEIMAGQKQKYVIDPDDDLPAEVVGEWVVKEKHERLIRYVDASRAARKKYVGRAGATLIDLYCGPGRVNIRETKKFLDGGVVAACRMARRKGVPFNVVHIGDIDPKHVDACSVRLRKLGETVIPHYGSANDTAVAVTEKLNPVALHFAYLDPYNLDTLPFPILERLSTLKRMDMLIHVSAQDLQRNLPIFLEMKLSPLDGFAPGWRNVIDVSAPPSFKMRAAILEHWLGLVYGLDMKPSKAAELVTGTKGQRLYWLMFASRHELAEKLWNEVRNISKQGELKL